MKIEKEEEKEILIPKFIETINYLKKKNIICPLLSYLKKYEQLIHELKDIGEIKVADIISNLFSTK